jgi:hypothetical protein
MILTTSVSLVGKVELGVGAGAFARGVRCMGGVGEVGVCMKGYGRLRGKYLLNYFHSLKYG